VAVNGDGGSTGLLGILLRDQNSGPKTAEKN